jgi:hypothetical protein
MHSLNNQEWRKGTGLGIRQTEHIHGHMWRRYSLTISCWNSYICFIIDICYFKLRLDQCLKLWNQRIKGKRDAIQSICQSETQFNEQWRTFELSLSWKTLTVISLEISSESKTSIFPILTLHTLLLIYDWISWQGQFKCSYPRRCKYFCYNFHN